MRVPRSDARHRFATAAAVSMPSSMAVNSSRSIAVLSAADRWYANNVSKTISADGIVCVDIGSSLNIAIMTASARRAAGEVALIVGLVLLVIWVIKPREIPALDLACRLLVGLLLLASPWIHGDPPRRLGLRVDNLGKALTSLLPLSLLAAGVCVAIGLLFDSIRPPHRPVVELLYYFAWAGAQQYALQAVVLQRLHDA